MAWTNYSVAVGYHDPNWTVIEDFVDRCLGFSIDQNADAGQMGTAVVFVELDNNDGWLTPNNGGAYEDLPWFSAVLRMSASVSSFPTPMFAGMITGFDLLDDGINSTVRLTAVDAFTIGGRSAVEQRATGTTYTGLGTMLSQIWGEYYGPVVMPAAGHPQGAVVSDALDPAPAALELDYRLDNLPAGAAMDEVNANVLPAGPGVIIPTEFEPGTPSGIPAYWYFTPADKLHRGDTNLTTFAFAENAANGELPFRALRRGYNIDQVTNSAQITPTATGGTQQTATDTTSIDSYGARNRQYTTADASNSQAQSTADNWVKRFAGVEFVAQELQVTEAMVTRQLGTNVSEWLDLLDVRKGWWNPATVTYTPTGGSERTDKVLITSRRIEATPADTTVTLTLRPLANYWSFTLDSATLGVLNTNRLG